MGETARAPGAKWQLPGFVIAIACSSTDLRGHLHGWIDCLLEQASALIRPGTGTTPAQGGMPFSKSCVASCLIPTIENKNGVWRVISHPSLDCQAAVCLAKLWHPCELHIVLPASQSATLMYLYKIYSSLELWRNFSRECNTSSRLLQIIRKSTTVIFHSGVRPSQTVE